MRAQVAVRRTTITSVKLVPDGYDVDPQTELIVAATVHVLARLRGYPHLRRHERLKGHLGELVEPNIGEHRGRIVKNTGDGFLPRQRTGIAINARNWSNALLRPEPAASRRLSCPSTRQRP